MANTQETETWFREWREQVLLRLTNLADGQQRINEKLSSMEITFARQAQLEKVIQEQHAINTELREQLSVLERAYWKFTGIATAVSVIAGAVIEFVSKKFL
jgi:hypothetical protein